MTTSISLGHRWQYCIIILSPRWNFVTTQILKDWHLATYVAVLAAIDIILLTIVTAIPEARSIGKLVVDQEHPPFRDATGVTVLSLIHDCESQQRGVDTYWFVILFGYKLVLQIIVTVLAFLVCSTKVNIEALNDHRAVQVSMASLNLLYYYYYA